MFWQEGRVYNPAIRRAGEEGALAPEAMGGRVPSMRAKSLPRDTFPRQYLPAPLRCQKWVEHRSHSYLGVGGICGTNFVALVRRAVVQQDQLEILVRLRQTRIDALPQEFRVIVIRYDDADCRDGEYPAIDYPRKMILPITKRHRTYR
jgi:hypothetical protein